MIFFMSHLKKILVAFLILFSIISDFSICAKSSSFDNGNFAKLSAQKALNRTLTKIRNIGEEGRIVVLICKAQCLKQRTQIPKWIAEFSEENNISEVDQINYHFHFFREHFPLYHINEKMGKSSMHLVYIMSDNAFHYDSDINDQKSFMAWLGKIENPSQLNHVQNSTDLDYWLSQSFRICESSHKFVFIIHHPTECLETLLKNMARRFYYDKNVTTIEVKRPLEARAEAILKWRLLEATQTCRMIILIHDNAFVQLDSEVTPAELYNYTKLWYNTGTCQFPEPNAIKSSLTEIQLEYLSAELLLKNIEFSHVYIAVGIIGGSAVVALAISIFWGLSGTSFVKRQ